MAKVIRIAPPPPSNGKRVELVLKPGQMHVAIEALETALLEADAPIFRRAGRLVAPHVEVRTGNSRGATYRRVFIHALETQSIREIASRYVKVLKFDARRKSLAEIDLPKDFAALLAERAINGRLRKINGVLNAPTLGPDWDVIDRPGFDLASGLYLDALPDMEPIPDLPSRAQAEDALDLLKDLLGEFPFANPESLSVALSVLITPVCAGAVQFAPLHGITAAAPGTGKSYLAQLGALIAYGAEIPVTGANDKIEDELPKQLTAALLNGERFIVLDNINGELNNSLLCQAVEQKEVSVRLLGKSRNVVCPAGGFWVATGNNLELAGDLKRRSVLCELARDEERPEMHVFLNDPTAMILSERGTYIRAAHIVVRAYIAAGMPSLLPPLASYPHWNVVRSALVWLGEADPCLSMERIRELDGSLLDFEAVLSAWLQLDSGFVGCTARELIEKACSHGQHRLREALETIALGRDGAISTQRLGYLFRGMRDRVFSVITEDGSTVRVKLQAEISHGKTKRWRLRQVPK
ncbi:MULTISPECIES: hypothetical protein [Ensifer]|uniref:hypothetical protein n=1 Tax=Ensifer TaxID=106591 RepID=UPI00132E739A|nr:MULTISPECIES: hypothetical protein [Ensifer]MBD9538765.1 hypothetical protein [Ensifer sp. ENS04]QHG71371.1 hypothetical protein DQW09_16620 [Ensifer adhaerens]